MPVAGDGSVLLGAVEGQLVGVVRRRYGEVSGEQPHTVNFVRPLRDVVSDVTAFSLFAVVVHTRCDDNLRAVPHSFSRSPRQPPDDDPLPATAPSLTRLVHVFQGGRGGKQVAQVSCLLAHHQTPRYLPATTVQLSSRQERTRGLAAFHTCADGGAATGRPHYRPSLVPATDRFILIGQGDGHARLKVRTEKVPYSLSRREISTSNSLSQHPITDRLIDIVSSAPDPPRVRI